MHCGTTLLLGLQSALLAVTNSVLKATPNWMNGVFTVAGGTGGAGADSAHWLGADLRASVRGTEDEERQARHASENFPPDPMLARRHRIKDSAAC